MFGEVTKNEAKLAGHGRASQYSRRHAETASHEMTQELRRQRATEKSTGVACRTSRRAKRTPDEQLALLDRRLGDGVGATRERARLSALTSA